MTKYEQFGRVKMYINVVIDLNACTLIYIIHCVYVTKHQFQSFKNSLIQETQLTAFEYKDQQFRVNNNSNNHNIIAHMTYMHKRVTKYMERIKKNERKKRKPYFAHIFSGDLYLCSNNKKKGRASFQGVRMRKQKN